MSKEKDFATGLAFAREAERLLDEKKDMSEPWKPIEMIAKLKEELAALRAELAIATPYVEQAEKLVEEREKLLADQDKREREAFEAGADVWIEDYGGELGREFQTFEDWKKQNEKNEHSD